MTRVFFEVFQSNTNDYMVLSNSFYLIIVICLHRVLWFQVFQSNNNNNSMVERNSFYLIIVACLDRL